jgi:hypothetical protein
MNFTGDYFNPKLWERAIQAENARLAKYNREQLDKKLSNITLHCDPSGLAVIEALAPQVSRYARACNDSSDHLRTDHQRPYDDISFFNEGTEVIDDAELEAAVKAALEDAVSDMQIYEDRTYFDTAGWHRR